MITKPGPFKNPSLGLDTSPQPIDPLRNHRVSLSKALCAFNLLTSVAMLLACDPACFLQQRKVPTHRACLQCPSRGRGLSIRCQTCHRRNVPFVYFRGQQSSPLKVKCRASPVWQICDVTQVVATARGFFTSAAWPTIAYGCTEIVGTVLIASAAVWTIKRLAQMNTEVGCFEGLGHGTRI